MSLSNLAVKAKRAIVRETAGRVLRAKAERADNTEKVAELVSLRGTPVALQPEDFKAAAKDWGSGDPATLHALADAESAGGGFEGDGRCIPAVEPHVFSCATSHAFDVSHPWLSYPEWIPYKKGAPPPKGMQQHPYALSYTDRWALFAMQAELDVEGACCGVSLGRFQQLIGRTPTMKSKGIPEGWRSLGFGSAEELFRKLCRSELDQLEVLHRFLQVNDLMRAFRERDWHTIARCYNGPGQVEVYAAKMQTAWKKRLRTYNV